MLLSIDYGSTMTSIVRSSIDKHEFDVASLRATCCPLLTSVQLLSAHTHLGAIVAALASDAELLRLIDTCNPEKCLVNLVSCLNEVTAAKSLGAWLLEKKVWKRGQIASQAVRIAHVWDFVVVYPPWVEGSYAFDDREDGSDAEDEDDEDDECRSTNDDSNGQAGSNNDNDTDALDAGNNVNARQLVRLSDISNRLQDLVDTDLLPALMARFDDHSECVLMAQSLNGYFAKRGAGADFLTALVNAGFMEQLAKRVVSAEAGWSGDAMEGISLLTRTFAGNWPLLKCHDVHLEALLEPLTWLHPSMVPKLFELGVVPILVGVATEIAHGRRVLEDPDQILIMCALISLKDLSVIAPPELAMASPLGSWIWILSYMMDVTRYTEGTAGGCADAALHLFGGIYTAGVEYHREVIVALLNANDWAMVRELVEVMQAHPG
ncbi:hypothetical protein BC828DRAFT_406440 [Blastocladiella britannica]|nr:hypothetical protein BC828DRAFT_406440 [Blastocladiella britannica]